MRILSILLLFHLVACASYVDKIHRQIDQEERKDVQANHPARDEYKPFGVRSRFSKDYDKRPIQDPVTYSLGSGQSRVVRPPVKRDYRPQRYQADDFVDNGNSGSLWGQQGQTSSLFTYQNDKRPGDIVIINVLENLRNQISSELKRAFPVVEKKSEDQENSAPERPSTPDQASSNDNEMDMKVYDKISGMVIEEVSKDYLMLRGRKEIIFNKEKRSIEVQALVSRKDIMENDYVNSDKLVESRVFVLRNNR